MFHYSTSAVHKRRITFSNLPLLSFYSCTCLCFLLSTAVSFSVSLLNGVFHVGQHVICVKWNFMVLFLDFMTIEADWSVCSKWFIVVITGVLFSSS